MNPRGKQLKVKQPNVAELQGVAPNPANGALPKRVIVAGKNPSVQTKNVYTFCVNRPDRGC